MELKTGKIGIPINFDDGDKETIYFNPNDIDLFLRLQDFEKNVNEKLKDMGNFEIGADGEPIQKLPEILDEARKIKTMIYEELDRAFDSKVSEKIFKHCSPLGIVDGEYFAFQFVKAIMPEIEKNCIKAKKQADKNYLKAYV